MSDAVLFLSAFLFAFFGLSGPLAFGSEPEIEPNDSLQRANPLKAGQAIQAAMADPSDKDVFTLSVSRESLVTLSFRTPPSPSGSTLTPLPDVSEDNPKGDENSQEFEPSLPPSIGMEQAIEGLVGVFFGDASGFPWRWTVALSSAPNPMEGIDRLDFSFGARIDTPLTQERTLGVKPGLYIIEIGPVMDLPLARNRLWSDQPYEIAVSVEPISPDRREIEPNNTLASAQRIALNRDIEGGLQGSQDKDLFRFRIEQEGYVEFNFGHKPLSQQDCAWLIDLSGLKGSNQEPIESLCAPGALGSLTRLLLLEPGDYVLTISAFEASAYSSNPYSFSLIPMEL